MVRRSGKRRDRLDGGARPGNGSEINWTLGTPNNGLATSAHSGTNAWGSNLNGDQNFFLASSFLYSPVIDLVRPHLGDAHFLACLRFQRIRFSKTAVVYYQHQQQHSAQPQSAHGGGLHRHSYAHGWQQETVDLTPFVGQTIQVVFYYQGVRFCDPCMAGRLTTSASPASRRAEMSASPKNLGQGTWSLFSLSPIGLVPVQSGAAPSVTLSNLPAGQYVVQFGDVPYYQTPADQTNTLAVGGTLNFTGNYTFLDVNSNGISDAWERTTSAPSPPTARSSPTRTAMA